MSKIKVSADTFLAIMREIMHDEDINYTITDVSAPTSWKDRKVQDVLNVEYYTFRHRPVDTEIVVKELLKQGKTPSSLYALERSFCILSLNSTERVFSKQNDVVTVSANLEYWIQSEKVKLLEDMFEDISVATTGERVPVQIGTENRHAVIALGNLSVSEIQENTEFGEMAVCDIDIDIVFYPKATSIADYKVDFLMPSSNPDIENWVELPISSISFATSMTQKAVPYLNKPRSVGSINLSRVKSIVLTFDGYENEFIDYITNFSLNNATDVNNNTPLSLRLTRKNKTYRYSLIVKEHTIITKEEIGNETHSLTLTKEGLINGTA